MLKTIKIIAATLTVLLSSIATANPEYVTINMEIDVDKPAAEVWQKIGGYCDIRLWLDLPCEITSGDGDVGTVRSLLGGRITEVMVGKTDLSYGYTTPVVEGQFYDLYHGFLEVKPATNSSSRIIYTLMYDVSNKQTQEEKTADVTRRRAIFMPALQNMKKLAEEG